MAHNITRTSAPLILTLGGNFQVEIFTIDLVEGTQGLGCQPHAVRAYLVDNAGQMDMVSLELPMTAKNIDTVRKIAQKYLREHRGYERLLNEINRMDNQ